MGKGKTPEVDGVPVDLFTQFDSLFKKYASQYALDWKLLKAIAMNESGLGVHPNGMEPSVARGIQNPADVEGSKSSDGKSWGLMQMTLPTARDYDPTATSEKLNNPEYSIRLSAQFVAWLTVQFKTETTRKMEWIVKSYNQGRGNTAKEMRGGTGYAGPYWERFQRNYNRL